jgi:hypothetical protein
MVRCGAEPGCIGTAADTCATDCACGRGGGPTYDYWTDDGLCLSCGNQVGLPHLGRAGENGARGQNGTGGEGCTNTGGTVVDGVWVGAIASAGEPDAGDGGGGGGGSAGAGFDVVAGATQGECSDALGGSGGGGGAGGCGGAPGTGGASGGSSFAVFIHYTVGGFASPPTFEDNTLVRGQGGRGGAGGAGGAGGFAGAGASGGLSYPNAAFCTSPGGRGGDGGQGGAGAGGGGGCGGNAYGIFVNEGANSFSEAQRAALEAGNVFPGGEGGSGGPGGVSTAIGSYGEVGADGQAVTVELR